MTAQRYPAVLSRERLRQLRKNERGKCSVAKCERANDGSGRCKTHRLSENDRQLAAYHAKKPKRAKTYKCGLCGNPGHNSRRCPHGKTIAKLARGER